MDQHPIPQNVTQYQFRLVGDMTLKQFLELAGGLLLAWLFYASNLIFIIKWPFALLSLFLGIALAFFPLEERPLDVWIVNFLKSIYAPTRFVWTKVSRLPSLFSFVPHEIVERHTSVKTVKAPPLPAPAVTATDYSEDEQAKIAGLESLLSQLEHSSPDILTKTDNNPPTPPPHKPSIKVRQLRPPNIVFQANAPRPRPVVAPPPTSSDPAVPKNLTVPTPDPTKVERLPSSPSPTPQTQNLNLAAPSVQPQAVTATGTPQEIHLPASPKKPNLVVGMVVNAEGHLVHNAIVEIVTEQGIPARAIKTNSLGQFYISTPLTPGNYTLGIEKEGLTFAPQSLRVNNQLIPPLLLRAS